MSKNLKSLQSGVLQCGASQFKGNIPSINGVPLSPATNNPVNFVFETTKEGAASFVDAMFNASVPKYTEEYTQDGVLMLRIFAAVPEVQNFFSEAGMKFVTPANIFCYKSGVLPIAWFSQVMQGGVSGYNLIFVNSVENTEEYASVLDAYTNTNVFFMKDANLALGSITLNGPHSTLIFNGKATLNAEAISMQYYEPEDPDNCNTTLVLAPQPDDTHIAAGAITGDVVNLYYAGEWNETTHKWVEGMILNLNGEPLDPVTNE